MNLDDVIADLKKAGLFSRLGKEELRALAAIAQVQEAAAGEMIFAAGDQATGFHVLVDGQVKLYKISPEGKEYVLRLVAPGETFAEAAAFAGATYPVFAEALAPSRLAFFAAPHFRDLIRSHPQLALNLIGTMAELLQTLNRKIDDLSMRNVAARLSHHLLMEAQRQHGGCRDGVVVELGTSKATLASSLGTISETLSRTLRKLQEEKLIEVARNQVTLLNCRGLQLIAAGDSRL